MSYINAGALDANGSRLKTKKALKEFCADPVGAISIGFDCTDALGPRVGVLYELHGLNAVPVGTKFSVCGPDPYRERKWYATVERTANGWKVT